jgi:pimeloyl-ACP methyl ester carboxylesterase
MCTGLPLLFALWLARPPVVASSFEQVAPIRASGELARSPGQVRAVVLIHGFRIRFSEDSVAHADLHYWQRPRSLVVHELARDADVFAFAYGQNYGLDLVAARCGLEGAVRRVKQLGYREIVLLGHSAGGLVAREVIEDHPDCGVTKVIQVCCPNGGTPAAHAKGPPIQQAFLDSLTVEGRTACLRRRGGVCIPARVQFVCVVGDGHEHEHSSDGVVPCACQWTSDLQRQGIPAVLVHVSHWEIMRTPRGAEALSALIRQDQPRWDAEHVRQARRSIVGQ